MRERHGVWRRQMPPQLLRGALMRNSLDKTLHTLVAGAWLSLGGIAGCDDTGMPANLSMPAYADMHAGAAEWTLVQVDRTPPPLDMGCYPNARTYIELLNACTS